MQLSSEKWIPFGREQIRIQAQRQLKRAPFARKEGEQERKGRKRAVGRCSDGLCMAQPWEQNVTLRIYSIQRCWMDGFSRPPQDLPPVWPLAAQGCTLNRKTLNLVHVYFQGFFTHLKKVCIFFLTFHPPCSVICICILSLCKEHFRLQGPCQAFLNLIFGGSRGEVWQESSSEYWVEQQRKYHFVFSWFKDKP